MIFDCANPRLLITTKLFWLKIYADLNTRRFFEPSRARLSFSFQDYLGFGPARFLTFFTLAEGRLKMNLVNQSHALNG